MSELHILNGDFALELWQKCHFNAQALVWKETYLEGPLPITDDLHTFRTARAEYLSHFAELKAISQERLYNHLLRMDNMILEAHKNSSFVLWFDSCIFDQTLLMRILYLLYRHLNFSPRVFLYCCNSNCLTLEDFQLGYSRKRQLLPADLDTAAKAWLAYQSRNAERMTQLAEQGNFARMPEMKKALLRCAEEVPDSDGLNRTQRQILQIVASGKRSFVEIFKGLDAFEEYPFLGDTACQRLLDQLVEKGLLAVTAEGLYSSC